MTESDALGDETVRLLGQISETRDYGRRSYSDVVEGVRAGELILYQGYNNTPVIRDARTHAIQKGSGKGFVTSPQDWSRAEFKRRFAEDFDKFYKALVISAVDEGNPKALEIAFKYGAGDHREQGGDAASKAMDVLLQLARNNAPTERVLLPEVE